MRKHMHESNSRMTPREREKGDFFRSFVSVANRNIGQMFKMICIQFLVSIISLSELFLRIALRISLLSISLSISNLLIHILKRSGTLRRFLLWFC